MDPGPPDPALPNNPFPPSNRGLRQEPQVRSNGEPKLSQGLMVLLGVLLNLSYGPISPAQLIYINTADSYTLSPDATYILCRAFRQFGIKSVGGLFVSIVPLIIQLV